MNTALIGTVLATLALAGAAQAAPVQLALNAPDTSLAVGTQADTGTGPLEASFNAAGGISVTEFIWWGYHLPGSAGSDQFEILLNGVAVGSQSLPLGTVSAAAANRTLGDPAGSPATVDLMRYSLVLAPGVVTLAGLNTWSVGNEDFGASWYWQGSGSAGSQAFQVIGDRAQSVPEPASLLLVLGALVAVGALRRRR